MEQKIKPVWWLILSLAIIKFILPFLLQSPIYELQRDEFLYYQQGQHLALGYLENPPLLSWMGRVSSWFGGTEFTIRCWPSLFGSLTVTITCLIAAECGGKWFAQLLAGLSAMTGVFLRVNSLFQPNMLDIFFWTLSIYFLVRFLRNNSNRDLYALAISLAIGFWSKYSVAFLIAALIPALVLSNYRSLFFQKRIYAAAALALLIMLPNIYWQYAHKFPLVHHMQELRETQLRFLDPKDFIIDQFLMTLPMLFVWLAGLAWFFKNKRYRFLVYAYVFVILLLMLGSGKSYYSLGIYPVLFAGGSVAWQQWSVKIKWLRPILILVILFMSWVILPMALAISEPSKLAAFYKRHDIEHKWEDLEAHPLPQDFADMLGWKELSYKSRSFFNSLPDSIKKDIVIYCRHYGQAGALTFYSKDENFNKRVITDNGSFLLWIPGDLGFKHLLFVGHEMPAADDEVFRHFEKVTVIDSVTNNYSRQLGDKIIFFQDADSQAVELAGEGLRQMKKNYSR